MCIKHKSLSCIYVPPLGPRMLMITENLVARPRLLVNWLFTNASPDSRSPWALTQRAGRASRSSSICHRSSPPLVESCRFFTSSLHHVDEALHLVLFRNALGVLHSPEFIAPRTWSFGFHFLSIITMQYSKFCLPVSSSALYISMTLATNVMSSR